jgi:hypothetical protein
MPTYDLLKNVPFKLDKYMLSIRNSNEKEDILANHKSFMSSLNIPKNEENCELSTLYCYVMARTS